MINGHSYFIVLPSKQAVASREFYLQLGFRENPPELWEDSHLLTDGRLNILLSPVEVSRAGLAICTEQPLDKLAASLKQRELLVTLHDDHLLLISPGGTAVYIFHRSGMPEDGSTYRPSALGDFYELSIETPDLSKENIFWKTLGFSAIPELEGTENWQTLSNQEIRIGQYVQGSCPHPFHSPAITFFMPDAAARIASLKNNGIDAAVALPQKPGGEIKEAIYADPDKHHLFLFQAWW